MARRSYRTRKLVPWYHRLKDRCVAYTVNGSRCKSSASWESKDNYAEKVCKTHMDILIVQKGWKFKRIRPTRIDLDTEQDLNLRRVS
jgi:hypothetical protein